MIRLSPRQVDALAYCILEDGDEFGFDYRTHAQLTAFFEFAGPESRPTSDDGSRPTRATYWLTAANRHDVAGASDLPEDIERIIAALLDRREFESDDARTPLAVASRRCWAVSRSRL